MRYLTLFILLLVGSSCNWTASREKKTREYLNEEIGNIDWEEVDKYPLFDSCDETVSKEEQKNCFAQVLLTHFSNYLDDAFYATELTSQDTIYIDLLMKETGELQVMDIINGELLQDDLSYFTSQIKTSLDSLPELKPALKRGIPVKAKFRVPIVLSPQ
ncbi:hypothetical protein [Cytophaga sp. FL35]|uniref:hypothetical protein n=1 Tax=Cytophaga sp. FL35 TaxID=1904456 RepID=UPI001653BA06|nr:hypothetical protein [Cytophaga sp. FL35]MBC6997235.1 hypothetical protein [Cytophaga sp. FL35]